MQFSPLDVVMADARSNPSEIAREALKRLAERRVAPTPANYQACYFEIARLPNVLPFPEPALRQLAGVLCAHGDAQAAQLARLDSAISGRSWQGVQEALLGYIAAGQASSGAANLPHETTLLLLRLCEPLFAAMGKEDRRFSRAADEMLAVLRVSPCEAKRFEQAARRVVDMLPCVVEEEVEIRESLLKLLHMIIENIGDLGIDDAWFKGQIDGLLAAVAPPLTLRHLDEMERRLRDVMEKQAQARLRSLEAQQEMREMLAAFIERLGSINQSSEAFQARIENSARQIEAVKRIEDLAPLLAEVVSATHSMAEETAGSREQLRALQERVLATEAELVQLHRELDNASLLARHDPLTEALNRKGLDEALEREIGAVRRLNTPLSLSMLDIDNFKRLNDQLGHEAGDKALIHLVNLARRCMRPSDTLARYGGEEFVILMPDTTQAQGIEAMTRLQRELTKAFFLADGQKVLITFSAGVAELREGENGHDAVCRADKAMYLAKRAGKNRVVGA